MASERPNPPNREPIFITNESLHSLISHQSLIQHLHSFLPTATSTLQTPTRQSYSISQSSSSSLLIMPSWSPSPTFLPYIGVKLVTHFPNNSSLHLPGIHASYVLFSSINGRSLASMDGTLLTLYRTSCVSGLASKFLSREDSKILVMIGAGALAPHLIRAHLAVRPSLEKVIVWNRTLEKAVDLVEELEKEWGGTGIGFESNEDLECVVPLGDIVSCATNAEVGLVKGEMLKAGAHLDLVGSFKESMRECDDEAIRRGRVFVDNEAALVEAGELVGALKRGVVERKEVGYLVDLITGDSVGRATSQEITVFKSVGSALVDLLAAQLVYESYISRNQK